MLTFTYLFEGVLGDKVKKIAVTKNFIVEDLKDKPIKSEIKGYCRKVIFDKGGTRHLINIALLKGGGTKATSVWHPKKEGSARSMLHKVEKNQPEKVYVK